MYPKIVIVGSTGKLGSKLLNYTYKNNINIFAIIALQTKKILSQNKYSIPNHFVLSEEMIIKIYYNY